MVANPKPSEDHIDQGRVCIIEQGQGLVGRQAAVLDGIEQSGRASLFVVKGHGDTSAQGVSLYPWDAGLGEAEREFAGELL
jgi:hypothetical protein